ncbi:MAG TPA: glycosyl hydrolase [Thermoleophilaceae bacterium]
MTRSALLAVAAACLALAALPATAGAQKRLVPPLFFGANWDGELEFNSPESVREAETARMARSGVESVRVPFEWVRAQPQQGMPIDHTITDRFVRHAAAHNIDIVPIVILAPKWARQYENVTHSPPKGTGGYTGYLRSLIARYGPNGTFWTENPLLAKHPIRNWQIWNEPHLQFQWSIPTGDDYAPGYGKLLRASYKVVKAADPGARVVLGGISNESWKYLRHMYEKGRIKGAFDVAALHPYTSKADGIVTLTKRFRIVLRDNGDAKRPLWITEVGLPASKGRINSKNKLQTTDEGMADYLVRAYQVIVKNRSSSLAKVARVYWYNWASVYCCEQFRFTGLLQYDNKETVTPKPAFEQYVRMAQRYEGCAKDDQARCVEPPAATPR